MERLQRENFNVFYASHSRAERGQTKPNSKKVATRRAIEKAKEAKELRALTELI